MTRPIHRATAALIFAGIAPGCGAGQLEYVEEQGQPARELLHDPNGNLVEIREAGVPVLTATHDAQDRLLTHGRFALE